MVFGNDEKCLVEVNRNSPQERYRYEKFIKGSDRHLFSTRPRDLQYVVGNKFILRGNNVNLNT